YSPVAPLIANPRIPLPIRNSSVFARAASSSRPSARRGVIAAAYTPPIVFTMHPPCPHFRTATWCPLLFLRHFSQRHPHVANSLPVPRVGDMQISLAPLDQRRVRVFAGLILQCLEHAKVLAVRAHCQVQRRPFLAGV